MFKTEGVIGRHSKFGVYRSANVQEQKMLLPSPENLLFLDWKMSSTTELKVRKVGFGEVRIEKISKFLVFLN